MRTCLIPLAGEGSRFDGYGPKPFLDLYGKPMIRREGKNGPFLGCSGYPKCRNLVEIDAKGNPAPA